MAIRQSTVDYSDRFVDLELMQTITAPDGITRLYLSFAKESTKIITGMQKLAQRYTIILLTRIGDSHFDETQGTRFWIDMLRGAAQNKGQVSMAFAFASADAVDQMKREDTNTDLYGDIPFDERITRAQLLEFNVDYSTATLYLRVALTSLAGDSYVYVMPVTVARR